MKSNECVTWQEPVVHNGPSLSRSGCFSKSSPGFKAWVVLAVLLLNRKPYTAGPGLVFPGLSHCILLPNYMAIATAGRN